MAKSKKQPASPEAAYILKIRNLRNPNDTDYAQAQRMGINKAMLYKQLYKTKKPFQQYHYLIKYAADIGKTPESIISQTDLRHDLNKELEYWKQRAFKAERERDNANNKIKELKRFLKE